MKTRTKDGKLILELLRPERKRLQDALDELESMKEYTRLQAKAESAIQSLVELLAEFETQG